MSASCQSRRLLAINFGGLGDEVLFLPTLKSIKSEHPAWHITLLTEPRSRSICQLTDLIDDNITFDIKKRPLLPADYLSLVNLLRKGRYDIVVSSGSSPLVAALLFLSGIKERVGYDSGIAGRLLLTRPVPLNRNQHAIYMYHDLVRGLGITCPASPPEIFVAPEALKAMTELLRQSEIEGIDTAGDTGGRQKLRRVIIHPGTSRLAVAKGIIKTWHPSNWSWLAGKLLALKNMHVILAGGPDDEETIKEILAHLKEQGIAAGGQSGKVPARACGNGTGNHSDSVLTIAYGKTGNLSDLAALLSLGDLLVCVDSAPMHIAVGLNKDVVALFGPTDPDLLLLPGSRFKAIRADSQIRLPRDSRSEPAQPRPLPGVLIQQDIVFQLVEDQLHSIAARESSPESGRT